MKMKAKILFLAIFSTLIMAEDFGQMVPGQYDLEEFKKTKEQKDFSGYAGRSDGNLTTYKNEELNKENYQFSKYMMGFSYFKDDYNLFIVSIPIFF